MLHRRFLLYFLILSGFVVVATVTFEAYSFRRAIDHSLEHNLLFARSVASVVGGLVEEEGRRLQQVLDAVSLPDAPSQTLAARLAELRAGSLDKDGVALFDGKRSLLVADVQPGGLPPPDVLLPALRKAEQTDKLVATDLWRGRDDVPRVALVRGRATATGQRLVVVYIRLDGTNFLRMFSYFLVNEQSRLQLLDSRGVALFSTRPSERFKSVVHGTYFTDRVRAGSAVQMQCHSCHLSGEREPVRENEVTTVAPVPDTPWSVSVREGEKDLFAPMRETVYTSSALVSLIFGTFSGFFLLLSRRVLRPMRQLAETAARITATEGSPTGFRMGDEMAMLAHSLQAMGARVGRAHDVATRPLAVLGAHMPPDGAPPDGTDRPQPPSPPGRSQPAANLDATLDVLVRGVAESQALHSAVLFLQPGPFQPGTTRRVAMQGVVLRCEGSLAERLEVLAAGRSQISVAELEAAGVVVEGCDDTRMFQIQPLRVLDEVRGQLWLGVDEAGEAQLRYLRPVMALIASQVQSIVERSLLYEQLRQEEKHKNRMLRHLFDAEAEERKRLAREIHDETAQELTALSLALETMPPPQPPADATLQKAKDLVEQILDGLHRMIRRLRPALLDDLGLVEAIRATGQNLFDPLGIRFELEVEGEDVELPREVENAVYRVFQEAATNIVRHAEAERVRMTLRMTTDRLQGWIQDDGRGLDSAGLDETGSRPRWGLLGMRERVVQLGGTIRFGAGVGPDGAPAGGLRIELDVPLTPPGPTTEAS